MTHLRHQAWPYVLVLAVAMLVGVAALDAKQTRDIKRAQRVDAWARYDSAMDSCLRGNTIRHELRSLSAAHRATIKAVAGFLESSARFRRASGATKLAREAEATRARLLLLRARLHPPSEVRCRDVIVLPTTERPDP